MRVRSFHRHTVNRSSTALGVLIPLHFLYSLCFSVPIFFVFLARRWGRGEIGSGQRTWMLCLMLLFTVGEAIRFGVGYTANIKMLLPDLCGYMSMCLLPQLVIICILLSYLPQRNELELSVCIVQLLLLCVEALVAVRMVWRLARNNTIDFYVALGSNVRYY